MPEENSHEHEKKDVLINQLLLDVARRRDAGQSVDHAAIAAAHPELMPELGERLKDLAKVEQAKRDVYKAIDLAGEHTATASADALGIAARRRRRKHARHPSNIGPFKILEVLGEGGMGTVYLAEQTSPIHRRVALKIIKLGMDTKQTLARFEVEREALALMNHAGVAKVFDAGVSDEGRPYFVMEYVPGIPITDYCDRQRLSTNERLELFMQVCHAVQHAHQKGIIHRDIKPSNVLVAATQDPPSPRVGREGLGASAAVKVIDFGVAKATQQRLTEHTLFTEHGQLIGTPGYMSPEQAEMTALDIDTRTDIYALGVLLYELLVGVRPFDDEELRQAGYAEIQRIIREVDPPKPSTMLSNLGDSSTQVAEKRRTEVRALSRILRGDLDWVVMKCLEKDRNRRYDTANTLAMEIQRHLSTQPVLAGPPSATYRLRKFLRRNKGPVAAGSLVVAVLIAGLIGTSYWLAQAVRARERAVQAQNAEAEQREIAEERAREAVDAREREAKLRELSERREREALAARDDAEAARDDAEAVTEFLTTTLAAVNPTQLGKDVTIREVLDNAATRIDEKFSDRPLIQAKLHYTIGWTYLGLGLLEYALEHLSDAAALYVHLNGDDHLNTLKARSALGLAWMALGDYAAAEAEMSLTLKIRREILGEEHKDTAISMSNLAWVYSHEGRYAEAEQLFREGLEIQQRLLGEEDSSTMFSMNGLATVCVRQSRYAEAERLYLGNLEIRKRVSGEEHPNTLVSMNNLANCYLKQGHYVKAGPIYRKILAIRKREIGADHPATIGSMHNLALLYRAQGRSAEAESLYLDTFKRQKRILGKEHPNTLLTMHNLARLYADEHRYAEAETLFHESLEARRRILSDEHPDTLRSMTSLATLFSVQGRHAEAEQLYRGALEIQQRLLGEENRETVRTMNYLADLYYVQGRYVEAEPIAAQAVAGAQNALSAEHSDLAVYRATYGQVLLKLRRAEEAEKPLLDSYAVLSTAANMRKAAEEIALALVELYEARHAAEPRQGYDAKAAQWRAKVSDRPPHGSVGERDTTRNE